jgi:ferredoxin--NADP+ reductase
VQVEEYADEIFDLLDNGAYMYFCGLKGMMPGVLVRPQCGVVG